MECLSYCIAEQLNLVMIEQTLKQGLNQKCNRYWNALELAISEKNQYCYFFKNGTMVCWNIKRHEINDYTLLATENSIKPLRQYAEDTFSYSIAEETKLFPRENFNVDCITLESDDSEIKLAISYGLSQSIKLHNYEQQLETLINKYNPLISQLAKQGRFKMSRRHINKILGDILTTKSALNLTSNFLYQPKFFWLNPTLEHYYMMVESYLDIPIRAEALNSQLDTLNEIFLMFNSYLENKHSHNLEIIIIVLIAVEIIFSFLNWHL